MSGEVILKPLDALTGDPDNPRQTDPERLKLVRISLRKLGFVLPLVATPEGVLLSGHQRLLAARAEGFDKAPVLTVAAREQGALNVLLNRATNDAPREKGDFSGIDHAAFVKLARALPDAKNPFPCLLPRKIAVSVLLAANPEPFASYGAAVAQSLARKGVVYPVIVGPDLRIVNGQGRLFYAARKNQEQIACVALSAAQAAFARCALNDLAMDFRFEGESADFLRVNAFRRARLVRKHLGSGFVFAVHRGKLKDFSLRNHKQRQAWLSEYGDNICDFGSGRNDEARLLRRIGVCVTPFEPYSTQGDSVSLRHSRASCRTLFKRLETGAPFASVFLSSVLNSAPFAEDRRHIAALCAALCHRGGRLFVAARGKFDPTFTGVTQGEYLSESNRWLLQFPLTQESGVLLGDIAQRPKAQKFYDFDEMREFWAPFFKNVEIGRHINNVTAICDRPRALGLRRLRAAIAFEFDLPFPDGRRLNMVEPALRAFSAWTGLAL